MSATPPPVHVDHDAAADRSDIELDTDPMVCQPIPVEVLHPVRSIPVGMTLIGSANYTVTDGEAVRIVEDMAERTHVVIISTAEDIYLGNNREMVSSGNSGFWPQAVPFSVACRSKLFARSASATPTRVGVFIFGMD